MAMALQFTCSTCSYKIRTPADYAGKRGRCPGCRAAVRVPGQRRRDSPEVARPVMAQSAPAVAMGPALANYDAVLDDFQLAHTRSRSAGNQLLLVALIKLGLAAWGVSAGEYVFLIFAVTGVWTLARGLDAKGWL